jgi:choice-of-anchor C domain-containing protein
VSPKTVLSQKLLEFFAIFKEFNSMKQLTPITKSLALSALTASVMLMAKPASAFNLITNGSFEEGTFNAVDPLDPNSSYARLAPGSSDLTGWIIAGVAVDWHNSNDIRFPFDGDLMVDLNLDGGASGVLSQTFFTTSGESYDLSFYLSGPDLEGGSFFPSPRQVKVSIAGVEEVFSTPTSYYRNMSWEIQQLRFRAIGHETTLIFSSVNDAGFWGPVLDNVSVSAVPEPITVLGSGIALGFGGFLKRKLVRNKDKKD